MRTVLAQISKIKGIIVSLLTYQRDRLNNNETDQLTKLYKFLDNILCGRATHKQYSDEEYIDSVLIEHTMVLKNSRNTSIKQIVKILEGGLKW